jgi:hypothetical protein
MTQATYNMLTPDNHMIKSIPLASPEEILSLWPARLADFDGTKVFGIDKPIPAQLDRAGDATIQQQPANAGRGHVELFGYFGGADHFAPRA